MLNLNKMLNFNKKEKSTEELARQRLSKETGDSGLLMGAWGCGLVLLWTFPLFLGGRVGASTKIILGIISIALLASIIFLARNYIKQKSAMESILESFLAGERNISNIAAGIDLDNKTIIKLIQTMISKGIIIDAYLDKTNNKIVDKEKTTGSPESVGKIVVCAGCGAKNTLTGKVGQKCEYCGAAINEETK